jgi:hypothetical protein
LVRNGALDIRTLGNAIDASLVDLKGGTTNQVLAKNTDADMDFKWVADASGIPATIFDAKGDLIAASAADTAARLAVGSNGQVLTADSSTATGLTWATPSSGGSNTFFAGKNKIINGDFGVNQRSFTSVTTDGAFGFDRWALGTTFGTTYSAQTFTAGTAPVVGYEGTNFARIATTGQSGTNAISLFLQRMEGVRTFAGQTATVSFWAKAASGTPKVAIEAQQNFGSGGSSTVNTYAGQITTSTSWARYSVTVAIPSMSGKTIGASNFLALQLWTSAGTDFNGRTGSLGIQNATIDIWGVQVEAGSSATDFVTASGNSPQAELAMCQRYFNRFSSASNAYNNFSTGNVRQTGAGANSFFNLYFPVEMRIAPTAATFTNITSCRIQQGATDSTVTAALFDGATSKNGVFAAQATIAATGAGVLAANNSTAVTIDWSAEL